LGRSFFWGPWWCELSPRALARFFFFGPPSGAAARARSGAGLARHNGPGMGFFPPLWPNGLKFACFPDRIVEDKAMGCPLVGNAPTP